MRLLFILFLLSSFGVHAQALRDINFNYLYSTESTFSLDIKPVRQNDQWNVLYIFQVTDTTLDLSSYTIQWELRKSLIDKESTRIGGDSVKISRNGNLQTGSVVISTSPQVQVITAKVIDVLRKKAWYYYHLLEPNYPVDGYLESQGVPLTRDYVKTNTSAGLNHNKPMIVSYYNDFFPAATPAFAESAGKVQKILRQDSTFTLAPGNTFVMDRVGLYLFQADTTTSIGFAYRAEEDYPRLRKVESLADPLIYVCTKQEYERMKQAKGDKKAFDRIILSITGNSERAKIFMRSYFKRVDYANQLFTSYKEGWKTDRGMIYIVFGPPQQVFRFNEREVWSYKTNEYSINFDFVKSPSLFDPDNHVLIRNKKYTQTWYEVIDLWRNARF